MPKTTEEIYQELLQQGNNYQQQANDYLNQYDNRGQFRYDANNDPVYQSLRDQYVHNGRRAMQDTMGQAAGLTGGYASSYGQSVGNQAYNEYLTKLSAQIPGLAAEARAAYDAEGDKLLSRYNLALNAAGNAYNQARDALGDMRYDKEYADSQAYQKWQMDRAAQGDAYDRAMALIQIGRVPDEASLQAAGLSAEDAKYMAEYYANLLAQQQAGRSGGGSDRYYNPVPGKDLNSDPYSGNGGGSNIITETIKETGNNVGGAMTKATARSALYAASLIGDMSKAYQVMEQIDGKLSDAEMNELINYMESLFGVKWGTNKKAHSRANGGGGKWVMEKQ